MKNVTGTTEQRLERIQHYIFRMPSLSTTVNKVLEICENPDTSPNDLSRVISLDPVLTGQVLRLINSAYYSLWERVVSPSHAISLLGINTVKNLVLSAAILATRRKKDLFQGFSADDFWSHCICVGVTAKSLADIKGIPTTEREAYFLAGLVHDLGKIPLHGEFPDLYARALKRVKAGQAPLYRTETEVFGFNHCSAGKLLAEKWRLGELLYDLLNRHHDPEAAHKDNRQFVATMALANIYAKIFRIGSAGDPSYEKESLVNLLEKVEIEGTRLSGLRETVLEEIEKAKIFLQITKVS
jgi:HD-like signal output (HDOD) protein